MRAAGTKRKLIALAGLVVLAALTWTTIGPGKVRLVGMIILGSFVLRIALAKERPQDDPGLEPAGEIPDGFEEAAEQGREGLAVKG